MLGKKFERKSDCASVQKPKGNRKKLCPKCLALSRRSCLDLYQVTDTTAVYLCSSDECLYQRSVPRDYKVLHRLKRHNGDIEHSEKTAALKNWTFDGKRAIDGFKCPMSFEQSTPEEACSILKHTVNMLGVVMGEDLLPRNLNSTCCKYGYKPLHCDEDLDKVNGLLRDHAELGAHKEACGVSDFPMRVEEEFFQLSDSLQHLNVNVPVYKQRVRKKYSMVDTGTLFKKWLGERFNALECHDLPCGAVDLSSYGIAKMASCTINEQSDVLDAWLSDFPAGEWDPNDSFLKIFQEDAKELPTVPPEQEATVSPFTFIPQE